MSSKRWVVKNTESNANDTVNLVKNTESNANGTVNLVKNTESQHKRAPTQDADLRDKQLSLISKVALINADHDDNTGNSMSTPPSTAPSTPGSQARKEALVMVGKESVASTTPPQASDGSSVESDSDEDELVLTKDEQLVIQMELREGKESGYDAFNNDTFGSDWVDASTNWSFEDNVSANEKLASGDPLPVSRDGPTGRSEAAQKPFIEVPAWKQNSHLGKTQPTMASTTYSRSATFADKCKHCGNHFQSSAKFCIICGTKRELATLGHAHAATLPAESPIYQSCPNQAFQAPLLPPNFQMPTKEPLKVCLFESNQPAKALHPEFPAKKMVPSYKQRASTTVLQDLQALCAMSTSQYTPPKMDQDHQPCIQQ